MLALLATCTCFASAAAAPRNLFAEYLGKTDAEVTAKIEAGWQQLFHGDDQEERVYYPVGDDMAYLADVNNRDVRSEGISYGMMIAVQLDRREEFDRLYRWAKRYMYHTDGPRRGYFAWQCAYDGRHIDPGAASDGEEWIATALFLAAERWQGAPSSGVAKRSAEPGDPVGTAGQPNRLGEDTSPHPSGNIDYRAEAQALLRDMLHKPIRDGITAIFHRAEKQVAFAPTTYGYTFTDPSYHLPAFYERWADWTDSAEDRVFWREAAQTSRAYFHRAAHPRTGLMPEYSHFDGRPYLGSGADRGDFRFDARRTLANVAMDHAFHAADPWQIEQSNRVLRFLESHAPVIPSEFTLEGTPLSHGENSSPGLIAMAAVAALAADPDVGRPFVQRLWDVDIPRGQYRYYDGMLYQLALLQVSGRFLLSFNSDAKSPTR